MHETGRDCLICKFCLIRKFGILGNFCVIGKCCLIGKILSNKQILSNSKILSNRQILSHRQILYNRPNVIRKILSNMIIMSIGQKSRLVCLIGKFRLIGEKNMSNRQHFREAKNRRNTYF